MLVIFFDKIKYSKIVEGKIFFVWNFILKGGKIIMLFKIFIMGKFSLEILDEIRISVV